MMLRCQQCEAPLPPLAPGYVLSTCRRCRATHHVNARGQVRRVTEGDDTVDPGASPPRASEAWEEGALHAAPTGFLVEERDGVLRVGWSNPSTEVALTCALGLGGVCLYFVVHQSEVSRLGPVVATVAGGVGLALLYPLVATFINTTWVEVGARELRVVNSPLPMPAATPIPVTSLRSVFVRSHEVRLRRGWVAYTRHGVLLRDEDGRAFQLADNLASESDARWVADILRQRLGLKSED
ncbi:hypothetical protein LY474_19905 [Myxococcus stipitatus]|uniref:hypothetical protein n=1 Tax=Myxococcus stipitatus TaxID=83455 RepID=UPI001F2575E0|nr:hypothetical protein [Myxococcus stipitatus]MCE9670068.1 hypothetical protein [Myxococcus stipitatus]